MFKRTPLGRLYIPANPQPAGKRRSEKVFDLYWTYSVLLHPLAADAYQIAINP